MGCSSACVCIKSVCSRIHSFEPDKKPFSGAPFRNGRLEFSLLLQQFCLFWLWIHVMVFFITHGTVRDVIIDDGSLQRLRRVSQDGLHSFGAGVFNHGLATSILFGFGISHSDMRGRSFSECFSGHDWKSRFSSCFGWGF